VPAQHLANLADRPPGAGFKTIADFRKDNGVTIRKVCREFVVLYRRIDLFSDASVAIDGSKFKAVNTRDRNFTQAESIENKRALHGFRRSVQKTDTDRVFQALKRLRKSGR
jgi:hypothetical protein